MNTKTLPSTLDNLKFFLNNNGFPADIQLETEQVFSLMKIVGRDFPLFLRVMAQSDLLQILVFIPCPIQEGQLNDLARLLHMLNKEVDTPGFCLDEQSGVVFYRLMLPLDCGHVNQNHLLRYLQTARNVCELFLPPIEVVGYGKAKLDEIIEQMQNNNE